MQAHQRTHLFVLGRDYHLGDLLWLTAVLAAYRRQRRPFRLLLASPNRPISHILDGHPLIDELQLYDDANATLAALRARYGRDLLVHDLRPLPIALRMVSETPRRLPWLYYRDLWLEPRGQWLATFLRLGRLAEPRPLLYVTEADRLMARRLPSPYVLLAPRTGSYRLPLLGAVWRRVKGWDEARWVALARALRAAGYEPITLAAAGQTPIEGTRALTGLPIRQVAGVIEQAAALVTVESGLWYIAAALARPFVVVPWWLPRRLDWAATMNVPHRLIPRRDASISYVMSQITELLESDSMQRLYAVKSAFQKDAAIERHHLHRPVRDRAQI